MDDIVATCKYYIANERYEDLQEYYNDLSSKKINTEYIFQKVFLFCCLHQNEDMVKMLYEMYTQMDPVSRIALRPALIYGKYIYKKPYPITIPINPKDY